MGSILVVPRNEDRNVVWIITLLLFLFEIGCVEMNLLTHVSGSHNILQILCYDYNVALHVYVILHVKAHSSL